MYDPMIGRWMQEDPEGFDAGDANLYRYVENNPTNATDPSGLQPNPLQGENLRSSLDISGSIDANFVRGAVSSLDTTYRLAHIPQVMPNAPPPAFLALTPDRAGAVEANHLFGGVTYHSVATPAQLARINLRVNLVNIKQGLVDGIYNMVVNNPPAGRQWNDADRAQIAGMANRTADDLIRMVDLFLRTHPGAAPSQGTRNRFGVTLGDRFSRPWCADWAEAMDAWINASMKAPDRNHPSIRYIQLQWGQCNNNGQHNFIVVSPTWHTNRLSEPGNGAVDPVILLFDPWRELLPRLYSPAPLTQRGNFAPTRTLTRNQLEDQWYWDHRNDRLFNERQLGLGVQQP